MKRYLPVLVVAAAMLLAAACSGEPRAVRPDPGDGRDASARSIAVHVVSHGWHTGVVVPAHELNRTIPELAARFGGAPAFYEIGWGDAGFYPAQDITAGMAVRALFWSSGTVLHVSAVPASPKESFPGSQIVSFCVSRGEIDALNRFISASFSRDGRGRLQALARGIYGDSQFYDASGRYSAVNTCNTWTAKGLLGAGFEPDPAWMPTARGVMRHLERHAAGHRCEPAPGTAGPRQNSPPA